MFVLTFIEYGGLNQIIFCFLDLLSDFSLFVLYFYIISVYFVHISFMSMFFLQLSFNVYVFLLCLCLFPTQFNLVLSLRSTLAQPMNKITHMLMVSKSAIIQRKNRGTSKNNQGD